MALISLKWFGGMIPRAGEQHLPPPHATEAENTNLYSGELRPLHKPTLSHQFCQPGDECFSMIPPPDYTVPPGLPEGPIDPGNPGGGTPGCEPPNLYGLENTYGEIGGTATFEAFLNPDADQPVRLQWYRNGTRIAGENSLTLTVDVTYDNFDDSFTLGSRNLCGADLIGPVKVNTDFPDLCKDFECDALGQEMVQVSGYGSWPLLDPNTTAVIPERFEGTGDDGQGTGLKTNFMIGEAWKTDPSSLLGRRVMPGVRPAGLCEGPYIMANWQNTQSGTQSKLLLTPAISWGGVLCNISIAVVVVDADVGSGSRDADNHLFRGGMDVHAYSQTATSNGSYESKVQLGRNEVDGEDMDCVIFNWGNGGDRQYYFNLPAGVLRDNEPALVQVTITHGGLEFVPNSYQGYFYAAYLMQSSIFYTVAVTHNGVTYSGSKALTNHTIAQVFDHSHGNAFNRPFNNDYHPWDDGTQDSSGYLDGGVRGFYNLSVDHATGGDPDNPDRPGTSWIKAANPGTGQMSSSLQIAFARNFDDYEPPEECEALEP